MVPQKTIKDNEVIIKIKTPDMLNVYINNGVIMEKIYKIEMILKNILTKKFTLLIMKTI